MVPLRLNQEFVISTALGRFFGERKPDRASGKPVIILRLLGKFKKKIINKCCYRYKKQYL